MITPNVTEIRSARQLPVPERYLARAANLNIGPSAAMHGYRERAADIRAMDSHRCATHGDLAIYCGCRS